MTIIYDNTHDMANFVTAVQEHNNYPHQTHKTERSIYRTVILLLQMVILLLQNGHITITERSYYRTVILQSHYSMIR